MVGWYDKIVSDPRDLTPVLGAIDHFEREYSEACAEMTTLRGRRLQEVATRLPGIVGYRYAQQTELEDILGLLEIRETALIGQKRRHYLEHYNRALSDRMVERFAEAEPDVVAMKELRNRVAAVRNKYVALSRHHEYLHFQLSNITKLRCHGIEEATL
jgi:hypothetical protein